MKHDEALGERVVVLQVEEAGDDLKRPGYLVRQSSRQPAAGYANNDGRG